MKIRFAIALILFFISGGYSLSQVVSENFLNGAMITGITGVGNDIWISTYGQGIYRYSRDKGEWFTLSTKNKNAENDFYYCIAASSNYVWAGGVDGLYIYDIRRNSWRKRKFGLGGEMGNWVRALCYDSTQNVLWIGRFQYLTSLDVGRQRYTDHVLAHNNDSKANNFKVIKLDGDSLVWFGTESGVYKYNKKLSPDNADSYSFINNKNGGFMDEGNEVSIADMLFQPGYVWFGTDEFISEKNPRFNVGGIYVYDRKRHWDRLSQSDGLPANGIYCLSRTGNEIWAGVYYFDKRAKKDYGRGLVLIDRFNLTITPVDLNQINIESSRILCMYFDGTSMWIGTDNGLSKVLISNPLARWGGKKPEPVKEETQQKKRRVRR